MLNSLFKEMKLPSFFVSLLNGRDGSFFASLKKFFLFKVISPLDFVTSVMLGSISGIAIILAINTGTKFYNDPSNSVIIGIIFLIFLYLNQTTQLSFLESCVAAVEMHLEKIRNHTAQTILDLEFQNIEPIPKEFFIAGLSKHYDIVNNGILPLTSAVRSIPLAIMLVIYLWYISWVSAVIIVILCIVSANVYFSKITHLRSSLQEMFAAEKSLIGLADDACSGFQEIKYSELKKNQFSSSIKKLIENSAFNRLASSSATIELVTFSSMINYLFAGCVVFLVPVISKHDFDDLSKIVAIALFLIGPVASLIDGIQQYELVRFSYKSIIDFKEALEKLSNKKKYDATSTCQVPDEITNDFKTLIIRDLTFNRINQKDTHSFTMGPINLELSPGKLIIIEGGNGSGKTTLIRLVTGLYFLDSGYIFYNNLLITPELVKSFRENFGVITSDYHVFNELYGISEDKLPILNNHMVYLDISKCCINDIDQKLNADALSTGQKKRLALAITLTEDKPIMVFDEWAADQDPYFREKFYNEILPSLKSKGKAIIVVSHDDRYFDIADERYHMEDGKMKRVNKKRKRPTNNISS